MTRKSITPFLIFTIILMTGTAIAGAPDKPPLELKQMLGIKSIAEVALSPDGRTAAFTVSSVVWEKNTSTLDVWLALTDGSRCFPLTHGADMNMSPAWTPDGESLLFLSTREGAPQVFVFRPGYGEAEKLFHAPDGVGRFALSPDGRTVAFLTPEPPDSAREKMKKQGWDAVEVDTPGPRSRLFLYDIEKASLSSLVDGDFHIMGFSWAPDGSRLAFVTTPKNIEYISWLDQTMWVIDRSGGEPRALDFHYYEFLARTGTPIWKPDGGMLAMAVGDLGKPELYNPIFQAYDFETGKTLNLSGDIDQFMTNCAWSPDGRFVYFTDYRDQNLQIFQLDVETAESRQITRQAAIDINAFSLAADGKTLAFSASTPAWPTELFFGSIDRADEAVRITDLNPGLRDTLIPPTEAITWKGDDGLTITGNIVYPAGYQKGTAYPTITLIHGGPAGNFNNSFNGIYFCPALFYAGRGYLVYLPNVRGSIGWGSEFMRKNLNDWGGGDYRDLMAGLDMLIDKGLADPERLVVWGGSYGGYMTNWIVTQTDRFKAAHTEVCISDLVSMWSISPIGRVLCDLYFDKTPIEDPDLYRRMSPLTYAANVKTPLLMTQNEKDQRVGYSPGQALEFYRAVENNGIPVQLFVYPGEGHGTRTPVHQLDKMQKGFAWFEKYLGRETDR